MTKSNSRTHTSHQRGFTLVEVGVASALVAVGVVGAFGALGTISRNASAQLERERMQRLAFEKYDELAATGQFVNGEFDGDFEDQKDTKYRWNVQIGASGITSLSTVTLTVEPRVGKANQKVSLQGLLFIPPTATGATQ